MKYAIHLSSAYEAIVVPPSLGCGLKYLESRGGIDILHLQAVISVYETAFSLCTKPHMGIKGGNYAEKKRCYQKKRREIMNKKYAQWVLLLAGILMVGFGIWRGEAGTVLSKAIRVCMECVGIG